MSQRPHSPQAEASVVGQMLAAPRHVGPVVGTLLDPEHFYDPAAKAVYGEVVARFYADEPTDALSVARAVAKPLTRIWGGTENDAIKRVQELATGRKFDGSPVAHADIIKRDAAYRNLLDLADSIYSAVESERETPDKLAGSVSHEAMRVATEGVLTNEIVSFDDVGQRVERRLRMLAAARAQGVEIGAYFGLSFIDSFTRGLRPSELMFVAGEPGAGKSAVTWKAAQLFAERQLNKPKERRIGTLVLSLEMADEPSEARLAQGITKIEGGKIREGRIEKADLQKLRDEWGKRAGLPLYFNYSSTMRASQLRAVCVEAVRKHNVGLVIIDHFRYVDMDPPAAIGRWRSQMEAEEALARFLKQDLATELNVAVICLAHTVKLSGRDDPRPRLSDLRGGQMVSAHADYVAFVYRPFVHASEDDIDDGKVKRTDAEMIWEKNRHSIEGTARFYFDPSTMTVY